MNPDSIFDIKSEKEFESCALQVFQFQFEHTKVYQEFCNYLNKNPSNVHHIGDIPFLPVSFFKSKQVFSNSHSEAAITFTSSGTTGSVTSKHIVADASLYQKSYLKAFELFYGKIESYCVLALLPSYLEREHSSLIYMVNDLIGRSAHPDSGFYLNDLDGLVEKINVLEAKKTKILLLGVSFALLDLIEHTQLSLSHTLVMETGGMKGRRKEMIREELHSLLQGGLGVAEIHSEYGMTELLSQAYSKVRGLFETPPWMKVLIRDPEDPLSALSIGKTGGVNIIDLANLYSCSFIATQDLGKIHTDGHFEILGRFDHSDIRGCNLMIL